MSGGAATNYLLPPAVVSRADLARLAREVESLDNEFEVQKVHFKEAKRTGSYQLPPLSKSLGQFLELNELDVTNDQIRMTCKEQIRILKDHAPVIHLTFSTEADPESLGQLVDWIRREIHPQALLSVGLQPALVGGVYMRTPNHIHDFSLRELLKSKRGIILEALEATNAR